MTSADDSGARVSHLTGWAEVIKSIPASARFFALVVLVINVLMGALVWKLPSSNLLFVALAVLAAVLVTTVVVSARSTGRVATAEPKSTRFVRDDFDTASARFEAVLNQFTGSDSSLKTLALEEGDGERLLDGLFAGLLEVARLALGQDIRTSAN